MMKYLMDRQTNGTRVMRSKAGSFTTIMPIVTS
jgi:hypothetical protein